MSEQMEKVLIARGQCALVKGARSVEVAEALLAEVEAMLAEDDAK